jgi:hypothetical protein
VSDITTIERVSEEFVAMRKAAREKRKAFTASVYSVFERTMRRVMKQYLEARGQGVSREDGIKGIELELRAVWPKSVSKFNPACGSCDDTGWTEHTCWERHRCGREVCAKNPERQHLYVEPCGCAAGDRMRKRVRTVEDSIAAAGRTQKRKAGNWKQVGG